MLDLPVQSRDRAAMPYRLYPMDTYFYNSITRYPFEVRCEMAAELGFDATYMTCWHEQAWADVSKLASVKKTYGLDVAAVYVVADIAAGDAEPMNQKIATLFDTIEGCPNIEIAVKTTASGLATSDPKGDEAAARFLERLLPICEKRDLNIFLYPHINFWLERMEDAVRLCKRFDHPRLGCMFCGFHWYTVDGKELPARLSEAGKYLRGANLCGSRRDVDGLANKATIEPLDDGEMDNFAVLGLLQRANYAGYIGFQGYATGGDPYMKLKRSLATFKEMEARLAKHPNWSAV
jgi:sugar phosphate isomerase/epimerase